MKTCEKWLKDRLGRDDFVLCDTIRAEAREKGFSRKELREARKALGVETINDWAANDGKAMNWFWRLPVGGKAHDRKAD